MAPIPSTIRIRAGPAAADQRQAGLARRIASRFPAPVMFWCPARIRTVSWPHTLLPCHSSRTGHRNLCLSTGGPSTPAPLCLDDWGHQTLNSYCSERPAAAAVLLGVHCPPCPLYPHGFLFCTHSGGTTRLPPCVGFSGSSSVLPACQVWQENDVN